MGGVAGRATREEQGEGWNVLDLDSDTGDMYSHKIPWSLHQYMRSEDVCATPVFKRKKQSDLGRLASF